jgi:hypothetical protein
MNQYRPELTIRINRSGINGQLTFAEIFPLFHSDHWIQVYYIYWNERPLKEVVFLMCGCEVKYDILPIDFLHINPIYVDRGLVTKGHLSVESLCNLLFTAQVFHKTTHLQWQVCVDGGFIIRGSRRREIR